jgi:predicted Zn-dependent protease
MARALPLALAMALASAAARAIASEPGQETHCPPAIERHPVPAPGVLLQPARTDKAMGRAGTNEIHDAPLGSAPTADYRNRLNTTPLGWPRLDRWCVWVQPPATAAPASRWDAIWLAAVERALEQWAALVPIVRVSDPDSAQIRIERRRPPRRPDGHGRLRASHGRAILVPERVRRQGNWRLEPSVTVLLGADQRPEALQATALHEIGHAIGLWGHSDSADDAMAAAPGPRPVLAPSERDRATLRWLYLQPTSFGKPEPRPETTSTTRNSSS